MTRAPTLAAIHAAELRVAQSRRDTTDGVRRARLALQATLARPSTLVFVAGAAGLLGYWLARRQPPQRVAPSSEGLAIAATTSVAGLVLAFVVRYAMQHLPSVLEQLWAARHPRVTPVAAPTAKPPDTAAFVPDALH